MRALILAAGPGSRLLPHTLHRPKCLLTIAGHAIIDYQIAALLDAGVEDIGVVVGYLPDLIKKHLAHTPARVTFIDNPDYASTSSSHSLWLARDFIRDGFIHLNSDLIFHPRMLRTLLNAAEPNCVIVDRHVQIGSDMMKAQMAGRQIMRMSKRLAPEWSAAEVVGPAKFSAAGARRIIEYLDDVIGAGERGRWAYDVFGTLAEELRFSGLDNPGCFWSEIDTPEDADRATQRMPRALVDFVAARAGMAAFSTARRDPAHAER